jgi:hypothetical protein
VPVGIAAVGIVGDCPSSTDVAVGAADPQVGYTSCGTWEKQAEDAGIILFLFFSLASATAFISLS